MSVLAAYNCMLFFRAASRPERPSLLFQFVEEHTVKLCLGSDVLAEMYDVLTRSEHQERFPALTPKVVDKWLSHWVSLSVGSRSS